MKIASIAPSPVGDRADEASAGETHRVALAKARIRLACSRFGLKFDSRVSVETIPH
jgi:hypothetical protein